jgi:putative nucleotidyltransferase with HDIG domain
MDHEQQILTILYSITMAIGGEISVKPLLTKTLQQLLYHTSFPCGMVFLDLPPNTSATSVSVKLEAAIGDYELSESIGHTLTLPAALLRGGHELREDPVLLAQLPRMGSAYSTFLRLPIDSNGVILLLAPRLPDSEVPLTRIFQPVMANLSKAILLCRQHDEYSAGLVTQRDAAWESLRKVNRALKTLSSGNEVLVRATEEITLLQEMCRVVVVVGGYHVAWVGYAQQDEQKSVRPMAQYGIAPEYLGKLRFSWADDEFGHGPTGTAIRNGKPQVIADALTDPRFAPWQAAASASGCASILALPLTDTEGHVFGALTIDTSNTNAFDTEEIRLLRELASDLSYGIVSLRNRAAQQRSAELISKGLEDTIQAIAATVEMRDPYTAGHQRRVAQLAAAIARQMGLAEEQVHGIRLAGTVHDIGKIAVPAEILSKPTRLSKFEFQIVQEHAVMGFNIMKDVSFPWPIAEIAHQHHERMDGSGYPQGLTGEAIYLEARIVAVADVIESMASDRPYRASLGMAAALEEISRNRGLLYDAQVVDACNKVLAQGFKFE